MTSHRSRVSQKVAVLYRALEPQRRSPAAPHRGRLAQASLGHVNARRARAAIALRIPDLSPREPTRAPAHPPVRPVAGARAGTDGSMETIKSLFSKPDPQAQVRPSSKLIPRTLPPPLSPAPSALRPMTTTTTLTGEAQQVRKCNALIRSNMRKLDRDMATVRQVEAKTKNLIVQADRRSQRDPSRAKQAQKEVCDFARELVRARRASARLVTSKAQLSSVQMQVNEAFAVRKIEGSIRASVGVMRDVNSLIRLPELSGTMRELSVELMKAGIIEDMVDDALLDDAEAEAEVDKVLGEILKDRKEPSLPAAPLPEPQKPAAPTEEEEDEVEEEDAEAMMDQMRDRLDALRS